MWSIGERGQDRIYQHLHLTVITFDHDNIQRVKSVNSLSSSKSHKFHFWSNSLKHKGKEILRNVVPTYPSWYITKYYMIDG